MKKFRSKPVKAPEITPIIYAIVNFIFWFYCGAIFLIFLLVKKALKKPVAEVSPFPEQEKVNENLETPAPIEPEENVFGEEDAVSYEDYVKRKI